jgi:hypothetical protein
MNSIPQALPDKRITIKNPVKMMLPDFTSNLLKVFAKIYLPA